MSAAEDFILSNSILRQDPRCSPAKSRRQRSESQFGSDELRAGVWIGSLAHLFINTLKVSNIQSWKWTQVNRLCSLNGSLSHKIKLLPVPQNSSSSPNRKYVSDMSLQKKQVQPELFTETANEWYHFLHMQPVISCQGGTKTPDNI